MPPYVEAAVDLLCRGGYEAYVVGGCVRDSLLGLVPKDWDITTDAEPAATSAVFKKHQLLMHGQKYGTVTVLIDKKPVEITTFRTDGGYSDNRRPDFVLFTRSLRDDLARRDFTINALAYSREYGLIDFFDGRGDIADGVVRCVGAPRERFAEDALRILRALRFASRFSFTIESGTAAAIRELAGSLVNVAGERVCAELTGVMSGTGEGVRVVLSEFRDVMHVILPELSVYGDGEWNYIVTAISLIPARQESIQSCLMQRLALLLLKIENAPLALRRLRFDNELIRGVTELIKHQDADFAAGKTAVKRLIYEIGAERVNDLLLARRAYITAAQDRGNEKNRLLSEETDAAGFYLSEIINQGECCTLKDLQINGNDLIGLGYKPGRELGRVLSALLGRVIEGECPNERKALLDMAEKLSVPVCGRV
jgi:tRNA nucleotidyltransferase (CCA-adding enzyme)